MPNSFPGDWDEMSYITLMNDSGKIPPVIQFHSQILPWPTLHLSTKFHENQTSNFSVILLIIKLTNGTKNKTSLKLSSWFFNYIPSLHILKSSVENIKVTPCHYRLMIPVQINTHRLCPFVPDMTQYGQKHRFSGIKTHFYSVWGNMSTFRPKQKALNSCRENFPCTHTHTHIHTQTNKLVNACTLTHNKTPRVNVYRSHRAHRGRKWTQWSGQLDVTDLLSITTGAGRVDTLSRAEHKQQQHNETSEQCPRTLAAVSLLFHHSQNCQMFI